MALPQVLPGRSLAGLLALAALAGLATLPSARSAPLGGAACQGTVTTSPGQDPVLACKSTGCDTACSVVAALPPPGTAGTSSTCACDGGPPIECCHLTLVSDDGGEPYPLATGFCALAGNCGNGRCALVQSVVPDTGVSSHNAKCLPWV